jgi:hypothetical protein
VEVYFHAESALTMGIGSPDKRLGGPQRRSRRCVGQKNLCPDREWNQQLPSYQSQRSDDYTDRGNLNLPYCTDSNRYNRKISPCQKNKTVRLTCMYN